MEELHQIDFIVSWLQPVSGEGLDPVRLQLDPPLLRLTLKDRVLSFGGTEALDRQYYLRYGKDVFRNDCYGYRLPGNPESSTAPALKTVADA